MLNGDFYLSNSFTNIQYMYFIYTNTVDTYIHNRAVKMNMLVLLTN